MYIKPNDLLTGSALACTHPKSSAVRLKFANECSDLRSLLRSPNYNRFAGRYDGFINVLTIDSPCLLQPCWSSDLLRVRHNLGWV